jgi:hypothetical protein
MLKWFAILAIAIAIICEVLGNYASDPGLRDTANRFLPFAFPSAAAIAWIAALNGVLARLSRRGDHATMVRWTGIAMMVSAVALSAGPHSMVSAIHGIVPSTVAARHAGADYALLTGSSDLRRDVARYFLLGLGMAAIYCGNVWWTVGMFGLLIAWCIAPGALVWIALVGIGWAATSVAMSCTRCGHPLGLELTSSNFVGSFTRWNAVQKDIPFTARRSDSWPVQDSVDFRGTAHTTVHEPSEHHVYDQVHRCRRCGHQVRRHVTT